MPDLKKIVIIGAGGLGREVLATIRACNARRNEWDVLGFLDADRTLAGKFVGGVPVLGGDDWCRSQQPGSIRYICAIGSARMRLGIVQKLVGMQCHFATVIHPSVHMSESVKIGVGTVVMAGTQATTDVTLGSHVVVYLNCSITHDVEVGDFSLVASGCNLSGGVFVETGVELGTGVCILPRRRIGAWSVIGAGSVVTKDVPAHSTAVGAPCRVINEGQ